MVLGEGTSDVSKDAAHGMPVQHGKEVRSHASSFPYEKHQLLRKEPLISPTFDCIVPAFIPFRLTHSHIPCSETCEEAGRVLKAQSGTEKYQIIGTWVSSFM